jgi:hypothetical protein
MSKTNLSVGDIYNCLNNYTEFNDSYFEFNLVSKSEVSGKYVYVQNIEQQLYKIETRSYENQIIQRAVTIPFEIVNNKILVWANKSNVNRLIFVLTEIIKEITLSQVTISINSILSKLNKNNTKITKVCFCDIALVDDLIGKFATNLYSYGDSYGILKTYQDQIERISFQYYINDTYMTLTLNSNGNIKLYKNYDNIDDEQLEFLKNLFLE